MYRSTSQGDCITRIIQWESCRSHRSLNVSHVTNKGEEVRQVLHLQQLYKFFLNLKTSTCLRQTLPQAQTFLEANPAPTRTPTLTPPTRGSSGGNVPPWVWTTAPTRNLWCPLVPCSDPLSWYIYIYIFLYMSNQFCGRGLWGCQEGKVSKVLLIGASSMSYLHVLPDS